MLVLLKPTQTMRIAMSLPIKLNQFLSIIILAAVFPFITNASPCDLDDVIVSKSCYADALEAASLPSDTSVPDAPHSIDNATLDCLAKHSKACAKCSRHYIVDEYNYDMTKSEKAIRENCLTLW